MSKRGRGAGRGGSRDAAVIRPERFDATDATSMEEILDAMSHTVVYLSPHAPSEETVAGEIRDLLASILSPATAAERSAASCKSCVICMDDYASTDSPDIVKLNKCLGFHAFHVDCITQLFQSSTRCPCCAVIYKPLVGTAPLTGVMSLRAYARGEMPLGGHEGDGTFVIRYNFPDGVQGPEHPSPGEPFSGTGREAYLPDSAEGRKVLRLLVRAFRARISFTVGQSITTGEDNTVVWNGIHHKTSTYGGPFGFPDPTYLSRVQEELAAVGIFDE
eukprot:c40497_g1_i1.p1 GENE.c40497_g1_i1~~c40497_g1_i1.p1  ORF type:complete len:285 (-),score=32.94 c40497_g1_i1:58-882(-)